MKLSPVCLLALTPVAAFVTPSLPRKGQSVLFKQGQPQDVHVETTDAFIQQAQHEWQQYSEHLRLHEKSVMTDPDLTNLVQDDHHKVVNPVFRSKQEHRHDSLLHEVEHAIVTDPDLANIVADTDKTAKHPRVNHSYRENEAHRHDSLLDEIQHAIQADQDLMS